jgi:hypothetical protein
VPIEDKKRETHTYQSHDSGVTKGYANNNFYGGTAMSARIIQLNFKYSVTGEEYEGAVQPLASEFAAVPGLRWKVWIINDAESEAGGLYVFDDQASVDNFLSSPLAAQVTSHPALSDFSVKQFDTMDELTAVTRGPIEKLATT